MAPTLPSCLPILVILAVLLTSTTVGSTSIDDRSFGWMSPKPACQGSIAECEANNEFEMDSESSRRVLTTVQYISYAALLRNSVPCSVVGASYYNCQPGAQANPYTRGCSAITRCRS